MEEISKRNLSKQEWQELYFRLIKMQIKLMSFFCIPEDLYTNKLVERT